MADPLPVAPVVSFVAGPEGMWRIDGILAHQGDTLPPAARLAVVEDDGAGGADGRWTLRGIVGPALHASEAGDDALAASPAPLGRAEARCAELIAVRKSPTWWAMSDDGRRAVIEERSRRITEGFEALANIARRLHHAYELDEPFDLLAWFEYPCTEQGAFDELLVRLRATEEWSFVEREVEIRVTR